MLVATALRLLLNTYETADWARTAGARRSLAHIRTALRVRVFACPAEALLTEQANQANQMLSLLRQIAVRMDWFFYAEFSQRHSCSVRGLFAGRGSGPLLSSMRRAPAQHRRSCGAGRRAGSVCCGCGRLRRLFCRRYRRHRRRLQRRNHFVGMRLRAEVDEQSGVASESFPGETARVLVRLKLRPCCSCSACRGWTPETVTVQQPSL